MRTEVNGVALAVFVFFLLLVTVLGFVALITVCLPLLFPDGRLPGPRWGPAVWAAAGCGDR